MHAISKITSLYWYRSRLFWLLFTLSSYTIAGFFILPSVIKDIAIEQIEQNLGWQGSIGSVELNPFALTLTISEFAIHNNEGDTVVSFDRYHNDIEVRSIIEGAVTFANFELIAPYIKLIVDENGKTNFQKAIERAQANKAVEPSNNDNTDSQAPKLLFDSIFVDRGEVELIDHTQAELIEHTLTPISFSLTNFSTFANKAGAYQLDVALGTGQQLAWRGNLGIAPFHSSGFLKVSNLKAERLWTYAQDKAPYTLTHGLVGIQGQYDISMAESGVLLDISNATLTLDELQIALTPTDDAFLDINKLTVGPLDFNLAKQKLDISRLTLDALSLKLERNAEGLLTLLEPFNQASADAEQQVSAIEGDSTTTGEPTTDTPTAKPFLWSIGEIQLNKSRLSLTDLQPTTPAKIAVENINSRLSGLSQDMTKSLDFGLSYFVESSGKSEINGQIIPTPLNLKAAINLDHLALQIIQPYLNDHARVTIEEGALSVNGDLTLASSPDTQALNGDFSGTINISQFNTLDQTIDERLIGWENLSIEPIKVNFNPLSIDINDIRLDQPYGRVIVTEDRSINLAKLGVNQPADEQGAPDAAQPPPQPIAAKKAESAPESQPIPLKINRILLNNGAAYFADLSLTPQFGTSIQNLNGEISGLSSENLERASVDIKGTIEDYGKARIKGKINPLSGDLYTDLAVNFDNVELSTMTPYSGRYAGYSIDKGKLNLHLNYKIANRQLVGENRLILDQFELGESVNSDESMNLPLELALAILKDRNGVIDIDLPTRGDLDDPNFKISGIVLTALTNVITKAATAPFSMIGNLVGGDPEALNSVAFEPGKAVLTTEQISNLEKLAKALNSRPQLMLEIRSMVDKEQDADQLRKVKLEKALASNTAQQRITTLEGLLSVRAGKEKLDEIKASVRPSTTAADPAVQSEHYEKALYSAALNTETISSLELTTLAKQRIAAIKTQLIDNNNVPNEQVFALQPSLDGQVQDNHIATTFNLTTR